MKRKICIKCHKNRQILFFFKDSQKKDGLRPECKDCHRESRGIKKRPDKYRKNRDGTIQYRCYKCEKYKTKSHFHRRPVSLLNPEGVNNICKVCALNALDNPQHKEALRNKWVKDRLLVLSHYSNGNPKCACCGEDKYQFLAIDHIDGNGNKHRKKAGTKMARWLRANNYPKGFQVLCHNCNMAKGFYGQCPHKK